MLLKPLACTAIISTLSIAMLACGGGGGGGSSDNGGSGTLSVDITDAAVDGAEKVYVQFTGITVKPAEGEAEALALSGDSQTCQDLLDDIAPAPTPEGEQTVRCIELKELQGTASASLIEGVSLNAGSYNWIRLDVDAERGTMDSIIVLDGGGRESLYIPSGNQTGLKLNTGFTILAGGSQQFVIDFDLRKSVNNPQGFADYRLKPALRLIDLAEYGNITGTVEASLLIASGCTGDTNAGDGFAVYLYEGADGVVVGEEGSANAPLTSASVSLNETAWEYTIGFIAPGDYTVAFTCQAADDSAENPDDGISFVASADSPITVVADQDSVVNFVP